MPIPSTFAFTSISISPTAGEADRVGDQQVRPFGRGQRVFVGVPLGRRDHPPEDVLPAGAEVHDPPHHDGVVHEVGIGPDRPEAEALCLHLPPVKCAGGEDRLVPPCLQAEGDDEVRVQVAQGFAGTRRRRPARFYSGRLGEIL